MTTTELFFSCTQCGKHYHAPAEQAGAKTKCGQCGSRIVVPAESTRPNPLDEPVSFPCRVCDTRLTARRRDIGAEVRCPDCHAWTEVPKSKPEAKKRQPDALQGEQYELYEGEDQPHGVDLLRASPKYIHFECRVCQTHLMDMTDAIGKPTTCPDCGVQTPVPEPPKEVSTRFALTEEIYDVDAETASGGLHEHLYVVTEEPTETATEAKAIPRPQRPAPGGAALLRGFLGVWRSPKVVSVWLGLALGIAFATGAGCLAVSQLSNIAHEFAALAGICTLLIAVIVGMFVFCAVANCCYETIAQGASGAENVETWPESDPAVWMPIGGQALIGLGAASAVGGSIAQLAALDPMLSIFMVAGTTFLAAPWMLLSQLEAGSPLSVFTTNIARTARRAPLSWLLYYLLASLVTVSVVGTIGGLYLLSPVAAYCCGPFLVAATALQCAWLLGRLGWIASSVTPDRKADEDSV